MHPQVIGRYQLLTELGRGGMAVVYRAHDPLFGRDVALKALLYAYFRDPTSRKRFEREARVIAALEHPFIVPVYDFGQDDDQPYLVMRYLSGGTLKDKLDQGPLSQAQATAIISRLTGALDHAHDRQVIHRDLKPGNVLFDQYDNAYLSDFGIARLIDAETQSLTGSGVIGTPAFMSPEQVFGDRPVDRRSDVYALGVLLYLMLSGKTPFDADTPAKLMMQHLLQRPPDIRQARPDLPPRLAELLTQALAKEPADRFARAGDLATALSALPQSDTAPPSVTLKKAGVATPRTRAGANDEEVTTDLPDIAASSMPPPLIQPRVRAPAPAPPPGPGATGQKSWWRRWPGLAVIALLLLAGLIWLPFQLGGNDNQAAAEPTPFPSPPSSTASATSPASAAVATITPPGNATATTAPNATQLSAVTANNVTELVTIQQIGRGSVEEISRSPAGDLFAVAGGAGVWLYDSDSLALVAHFDGHKRSVRTAAWSPDGRLIASASDDGAILVWDVASGMEVQQFSGHTDWVRSLRWSPDGARLLSGGNDGTARLWDVATGGAGATMASFAVSVRSVAWSPDGQRRAIGLQNGELIFYDATGSAQNQIQPSNSPIISLAWSPTSNQLAAGTLAGQLTLWEPNGSAPSAEVTAHLGAIYSLSWSVDGQQLLTTSNDQLARLWTISSMTALDLAGHTAPVTSGAWLDENRLITGGVDGVLRLWDATSGSEQGQINGHMTSINSAGWAADGTMLALGLSDATARIWRADGEQELFQLTGHSSWVSSLSFSPDSSRLLTADFNGQIRLWDTNSGELLDRLGSHRAIVNSVGWAPAGQYAASGGKDRLIQIWDTTTLSQPLFITLTHSASVEALAFSPDGAFLASGDAEGNLLIWDWQKQQVSQQLNGHSDAVRAISWSPDGTQLASSSNDGTIRVWSLATGQSEHLLRGHDGWVNTVSWSPEGDLLASGGFDGAIMLWSASSGERLHTLTGPHYAVWSVNWSPDGATLLSGSGDGTARLWALPE